MSYPSSNLEHTRDSYYRPSAETMRELDNHRHTAAHSPPPLYREDFQHSPPRLPRPGQGVPRTPSRGHKAHPQPGSRSCSDSGYSSAGPRTPGKSDRPSYHPYPRSDIPGPSMDIDRSPRKGARDRNVLPALAPAPELPPPTQQVVAPSSAEWEVETQRDEMTYLVALRDEEIKFLHERFRQHDANLTELVNKVHQQAFAGKYSANAPVQAPPLKGILRNGTGSSFPSGPPSPVKAPSTSAPKGILLNGSVSGSSVPSRPPSPVKPTTPSVNLADLDRTATLFQAHWREMQDMFAKLGTAEVTPDEHWKNTGDAEPILQTRNALLGRATGRPRNPYVQLPLDHIMLPGIGPKVIDVHVHASEKGIGFGFGTHFLMWRFKNNPTIPFGDISFPVWAEVIAVEMGLRALFAHLRANNAAAQGVRIWSDNLLVVGALPRVSDSVFRDINKEVYTVKHSARFLADKNGWTMPHVERLCKWMRDNQLTAMIGWIPSKFNIASGTSKGTAPRGHQRLPCPPVLPPELANILELKVD